jgi:hypothetical protein
MSKQEFAWVYNPKQATFLLQNCCNAVEFGTGAKGDRYVKFIKDDNYRKLFDEWCNRKY